MNNFTAVRNPDAFRSFQLAAAYYLTCSEDSSEGDYDPTRELLSVETHRRAATGNTKSREVARALAGTAPSSTARNSVTRPENVWKAGHAT